MVSPVLAVFLTQLAQNPMLLEQFNQNPVATMTVNGLGQTEQALLLSGDAAALQLALGSNRDSIEILSIKSFKK